MPKSRAEILADVKVGVAEYVKFRKRFGPPVTFVTALRLHREQIEAAFRDCPNDDDLRERLSLLDDLMAQEGVGP